MKKLQKNHKLLRLCTALLLCSLLFTQVPVVHAEEAPVISIETADDLKAFAKSCTIDSYSKGKIFMLKTDIDLEGAAFLPIPSFSGSFLGGGHTISDFSITSGGSSQGFFRFVEKDGLVQNLKLSGNILPDGSETDIGGIVGTNHGKLINCQFTGTVSAKENVGGIAGVNTSTGTITGCKNHAVVTGIEKTGGIAGNNSGIIMSCSNLGEINTADLSDQETDVLDEGSLTMEDTNVLEGEKVNNTGGIAGVSTGIISSCSNNASIGYQHAGYNTGGVAGLQNGYIGNCRNHGLVIGRKDVGGIVGQFEPYIEITYQEDNIQKGEKQVNQLLNLFDGLSDIAGNTGDSLVSNMNHFSDSMDQVKQVSDDSKAYYWKNTKTFSDDVDYSLTGIDDSLNNMGVSINDSAAKDTISTIQTEIKNAEAAAKDFVTAVTPDERENAYNHFTEALSASADGYTSLIGQLADTAKDTDKQISEKLKGLQSQTDHLQKLVQSNKENLIQDIEKTDADMSAAANGVSDSLNQVSDTLQTTNQELQSQMDSISRQIKNINNTVTDGIDALTNPQEETIVDISDSNDDDMISGKVLHCVNIGTVESDSNVGGIAGTIALEVSADPETDIEVTGEESLIMKRTARATLRSCTNKGDVTSQNDCSGGIAGKADNGALIANENYGTITSSTGSYVGGIAGSSSVIIRKSYSLSFLKGKDYIGGIAGKGNDLKENYAMTAIDDVSGERLGAIAGYTNGTAEGNYFVDQNLAAIDGITYEAQALPISYQELISMPETPLAFHKLTVRFVADDRILQTLYVNYGQSVASSDIPGIPEKTGNYADWEPIDLNKVTQNLTVHARYYHYTTTISSEQKNPLFLIDADFSGGTAVAAEETDPSSFTAPSGYSIVKAYSFSLNPAFDKMSLGITVHIRNDSGKKNLTAAMDENGIFTLKDTHISGSYLLFDTTHEGTVLILEKKVNPLLYVPVGAGIILAVFAVLHIRKKRKATAQA